MSLISLDWRKALGFRVKSAHITEMALNGCYLVSEGSCSSFSSSSFPHGHCHRELEAVQPLFLSRGFPEVCKLDLEP